MQITLWKTTIEDTISPSLSRFLPRPGGGGEDLFVTVTVFRVIKFKRFSQGASLKPDESEGYSPVSGTIRLEETGWERAGVLQHAQGYLFLGVRVALA